MVDYGHMATREFVSVRNSAKLSIIRAEISPNFWANSCDFWAEKFNFFFLIISAKVRRIPWFLAQKSQKFGEISVRITRNFAEFLSKTTSQVITLFEKKYPSHKMHLTS